jgi:Peroxisome biogenesis factor 1, N-terminal
VSVVPLPHNWVRLPQAYVNKFLDEDVALPAVLRLRRAIPAGGRPDVYVGWTGLVASQPGCVEVPKELADSLKLPSGEPVSLTLAPGLPTATLVHASVRSAADWEVLEVDAEHLTSSVLAQLKVVRAGDEVPVWVRGQSSVRIRIETVSPASTALLQNDTILSIQPPAPPVGGAESRTNGADAGAGENGASARDNCNGEAAVNGAAAAPNRRDGGGGAMAALGGPLSPPKIRGPLRVRVQVWWLGSRMLVSAQSLALDIAALTRTCCDAGEQLS